MPMFDNMTCPVCGGMCSVLDVVDFNGTTGLETTQGPAKPSGTPVRYMMCGTCGFCFAPDMGAWTREEFEQKIYNDHYTELDPDYLDVRPRANANTLLETFGDRGQSFRHLDYGGGNGLLSSLLNDAHWHSVSYDPYGHGESSIGKLGKFNLITAFEVFEHVPDAHRLMGNLQGLLAPDGVVIFSTLLSDGHLKFNERITWPYVTPRNGHITLYSSASLAVLGAKCRWHFGSFSELLHAFYSDVPVWASHLIRSPEASKYAA